MLLCRERWQGGSGLLRRHREGSGLLHWLHRWGSSGLLRRLHRWGSSGPLRRLLCCASGVPPRSWHTGLRQLLGREGLLAAAHTYTARRSCWGTAAELLPSAAARPMAHPWTWVRCRHCRRAGSLLLLLGGRPLRGKIRLDWLAIHLRMGQTRWQHVTPFSVALSRQQRQPAAIAPALALL